LRNAARRRHWRFADTIIEEGRIRGKERPPNPGTEPADPRPMAALAHHELMPLAETLHRVLNDIWARSQDAFKVHEQLKHRLYYRAVRGVPARGHFDGTKASANRPVVGKEVSFI
jgi:hypothetical protein